MENYNILVIDGGGIRGLIALIQIVKLEEKLGGDLLKYFKLISGTSTGAIIATLIASGITAKELINLYVIHGPSIFEKKFLRFGLLRPKYDDKYFNQLLGEYCGDLKMSQLKCEVIIPAYNISKRRIDLFKRKDDLLVKDVIRASSSAQTYFKPWSINGENYIDGGMAVNNPSEYCFAEAKDITENIIDVKINIISFGTGITEKEVNVKGGILKWAKPTVEILLAEMSQKTDALLSRYYKKESGIYTRCESFVRFSSGKIDDATDENLEDMIQDGVDSFELNEDRINNFVKKIK